MKPGNQVLLKELNNAWEEIDTMMLFACFTLLESFVQNEMHLTNWENTFQQKKIKQEIDFLAQWWNKRKSIYKGLIEETKNQEHEDTKMLIRLINIRTELWS